MHSKNRAGAPRSAAPIDAKPTGRRLRNRLIAGVAVLGLIAGVPTATSIAQPIGHTACTRATIGGQSKCIARGQYCARAYQRDYLRYGLSCSNVDVNGRYHLT